ncbi:hypothetical protein PIB30_012940 [Stylosanthes scabra]|uniref:Ubiquitin-like protease family profile domain-containing protein n=1 Tax=Stylosanthes scabra TaxID=79078 RepID=A0ABU6Y860_9FABA|nr:hypothetical protein [Stylosanthes scabra]
MAGKQHEHDLTKRWWLPPNFGEIALNTTSYDPNVLAVIRKKFLGWADRLAQVYVPLLRNGHWYLLIVDMYYSELVYLDSLKNDDDIAERKKQMKFVAFFLETLLSDKGFYKEWDGLYPKCSTYDFSEPWAGQQDELSNDCGVWVAQWMLQATLWGGDHTLEVNATTRHNPVRTDICRMAVDDWDKKVMASFNRKKKKAKSAVANAVVDLDDID